MTQSWPKRLKVKSGPAGEFWEGVILCNRRMVSEEKSLSCIALCPLPPTVLGGHDA